MPELTPYFVNTRKIVRRQVNGFSELLPVDALNPLWGGGNDWLPESGAKLAGLDPDKVIEERAFQLRPGGIPAFVEGCNAHGVEALRTCRARSALRPLAGGDRAAAGRPVEPAAGLAPGAGDVAPVRLNRVRLTTRRTAPHNCMYTNKYRFGKIRG